MSATPQFIPIKKGRGEAFSVASWRDSPGLKPREGPVSPTPAAPKDPSANTPQTTPQHGPRRRGKSTSQAKDQAPEEVYEDFLVKTALGPFPRRDAETALVHAGLKPLRTLVIGAARSIPLTKIGNDDSESPAKLSGSDTPTDPPIAPAGGPQVPAADPFKSPIPGGQGMLPDDDGLPPEMELPPSIPTNSLDTAEVHYFYLPTSDDANRAVRVLQQLHTEVAAEAITRKRSSLNSTLVVKSLPFNFKCDRLIEEVERLPNTPSYIRLHRGERGLFKCVLFIKYPNRTAAEASKLELERLTIGSRPLRLEFKKHVKAAGDVERQRQSSVANLEKVVKDLRASNDNEGFFYPKTALNKDDARYLKQLCVSFDLVFDSTGENYTVKRKIGAAAPVAAAPAASSGAAATKSGISPAMRPTTPPWVPSTPGSLQPMEFRGIRHWKEQRQKASTGDPSTLQIYRPLGVGDAQPFAAGRGRPAESDT